ncbi:type I restriction enzyme S subunit [Sagittula marina]|uniref:Type I restriction enzyme S subunit n=1 Tax=Sagittula marina TaxID=943940 RepID=A0A7W6DSL4_9RHOB|nr:restriction endonuclease subunit S [Sagittula marina]MBB3988431.1 type I restriction enzyme S subunit [Sagittula marina]
MMDLAVIESETSAPIPSGWSERKLQDVAQLINGRGFKPFEWDTAGLPIIRIQNLNGSDDFNYYSGRYDPKIEVDPGQLLFAWSGSRGTSFGPHIWNGPKGVLNYHTWKVRVNESEIVPSFFFHVLRHLTRIIEDQAHGASALVHVQKWEMEKFPFQCPDDPDEQEAIAEALSDADALIEGLERLIAKKRLIKQGAMQDLLTAKRRLPGFSGEWERARVGSFTRALAGGTPSTRVDGFWGGDVPWMSSGELHAKRVRSVSGRITPLGLASSSATMVPVGCVLLGLAGQGKTRGTAAINEIELCTNQSIAAILPSARHSSDFLFHEIDRRYDELRALSTGDGGRGGLNLRIIHELEVPFPCLAEQERIASRLNDMDAEIQALDTRLEKARQVKEGMMQNLLTGRIRLV